MSTKSELIRVLSGQPGKYGVRLWLKDKEVLEFETDFLPKVEWQNETRTFFLFGRVHDQEYPSGRQFEIMEWDKVLAMFIDTHEPK
jgi:hypothetical protein